MNTQQLHTAINEAFTDFKSIQTSRRHRMDFAESLTEDYFAQHGKMPESTILDRLATLILQDELADKHPDKMTRGTYPLLSDSQADERYADERSFKAAQDVATDGADYRVKTRDSNRRIREVYGS